MNAASEPFRLGQRPALDGLRGLAIVFVLLLHLTALHPSLRRYFEGGFIGVEMFFVLSGFLITSIVLSEIERADGVDLRSFYRRRALRLVPALYVMVAVCVAVSAVHPIAAFSTTGRQLLIGGLSATYVMNMVLPALPSFNELPTWSQPLWSLCVEVHFYLLWPPLLVLVARRNAHWLIRVALGTIVLSWALRIATFVVLGHPYQNLMTPGRFDALATGALVAIALHRGWRPPTFVHRAAVGALGVFVTLLYVGRADSAWMVALGYTITSIGTAAVLVSALDASSIAGRALNTQPLRLLGQWSYSLYLWHLPVYWVLRNQIQDQTALTVASLAVALVIAAASVTWIEVPLRRLGHRRSVRLGH